MDEVWHYTDDADAYMAIDGVAEEGSGYYMQATMTGTDEPIVITLDDLPEFIEALSTFYETASAKRSTARRAAARAARRAVREA